jgi:hypothetical protein
VKSTLAKRVKPNSGPKGALGKEFRPTGYENGSKHACRSVSGLCLPCVGPRQ